MRVSGVSGMLRPVWTLSSLVTIIAAASMLSAGQSAGLSKAQSRRIETTDIAEPVQSTTSFLPNEAAILPLPAESIAVLEAAQAQPPAQVGIGIKRLVVLPLTSGTPEYNTFSDWPVAVAKDVTRTLQQQTSIDVISPDEWEMRVRMYGLKASSDRVLASCRRGGNPDTRELLYLMDGMRVNNMPVDAVILVEGIVDRQHRLNPTDENKWVWLQKIFQTTQPDAYYRLEGMLRLIQPRVSSAPVWEHRAAFGLPYERLTTVTASVYDEPNNGYVMQHQAQVLSQHLLSGFPLLLPPVQKIRGMTKRPQWLNSKAPALSELNVKADVQTPESDSLIPTEKP